MKLNSTLFLVLWCISAFGSVNILPINTRGDLLKIEDIFSTNILNGESANIQVVLKLKLLNETRLVYEGQTQHVSLKRGLNLVNLQGRITNNLYPEKGFRDYVKNNGHIPSGNYRAQISVMNHETMEPLLEYEYDIKAGREIVLHLVYPRDESKITSLQSFNWSPVVIRQQHDLTYRISVADVRGGQTPEEALYNNPLHIENNRLRQPTLLNSPVLKPFEEGKVYAWQVLAYLDNNLLASSEVWTFSIDKEAESAKETEPIPIAKSHEMGSYLTAKRDFHFKTVDRISPNYNLRIVDVDRNKEVPIEPEHLTFNGGNFDVDLSNLLKKKKKKYLVIVKDLDLGRSYYLKIIY